MFKVNDKVIIRRGKHKGGAKVVLEADPDGQIGVRTDAGYVLITNAENLKAPDEATIGASRMSELISEMSKRDPEAFNAGLIALTEALHAEGVHINAVLTHSEQDTEHDGSTVPPYGAGPGEGR